MEQVGDDHHSLNVLEVEPRLDQMNKYALCNPRVYRCQALKRGRKKEESFPKFVFPILGSFTI
jgi:hypothetical protein